MKKFYRLENEKTHEGVYQTDSNTKQYKILQDNGYGGVDDARHPAPDDDTLLMEEWLKGGVKFTQHYIFGFKDISQYRSWFFQDDVLKELEECGVCLSLYETDDCCIGHSQMIANKYTVKFVGRCNILTGKLKPKKRIKKNEE